MELTQQQREGLIQHEKEFQARCANVMKQHSLKMEAERIKKLKIKKK